MYMISVAGRSPRETEDMPLSSRACVAQGHFHKARMSAGTFAVPLG